MEKGSKIKIDIEADDINSLCSKLYSELQRYNAFRSFVDYSIEECIDIDALKDIAKKVSKRISYIKALQTAPWREISSRTAPWGVISRSAAEDITYLEARLMELGLERKRGAKSVLLSLTLMLWGLTPIAFLSIPLIGITCGLTAIFSTWCYIKARKNVI
jgi:hypothetical protein